VIRPGPVLHFPESGCLGIRRVPLPVSRQSPLQTFAEARATRMVLTGYCSSSLLPDVFALRNERSFIASRRRSTGLER
jgi:hypothetical protein